MKDLKEKKEHKLGFIVLIVSTLICMITISYAAWSKLYNGNKENSIKTGTLILKIKNDSNTLSLLNSIPLSDEKGMQNEAYYFTVQNTGSAAANYMLSVIDDEDYYTSDNCYSKKLPWDKIRYSFKPQNKNNIVKSLNENSGVLYTDSLEPNEEKKYSLKLWVDKSTTIEYMEYHFHGKIQLNAVQKDQTLTN